MIINNIKLLFVLIKNIRSKEMNRKMIGYSVRQECSPVSLKDIRLFLEATLDNNISSYMKNGYAPLFFVSKLIMPSVKKIMMHKDLNLNLLKLVHSGQEVIWHDQIKTGDRVILELKISDITDATQGELLVITMSGFVNNLKIVEGKIKIIIRGARKKGIKRENGKMEKTKELYRLNIPTQDGQQIKYARITGDNNFIHTSNLIAKRAGLSRTIMHGACVMAMTCNALVSSIAQNNINKVSSMSVRFSYPVIPGEVLELICYKGRNKNEVFFNLLNTKGREVLKDGVFSFK